MQQPHSFMFSVVIPGVQSAITGLLVGVLLGIVGGMMHWDWHVAVGGGLIVMGTAWLDRMNFFTTVMTRVMYASVQALPMVEPIRPERSITRIEANLLAPGGEVIEGQFAEFPLERRQFEAVARDLLEGKTLEPNRFDSRKQLDACRSEMLNRGWLAWKHPTAKQQGVELTRPGRAVMRQIVPTPLLEKGDVIRE